MKYNPKFRTIFSHNEHKSSDAALRQTLKNKIGEFTKEG